MRQAGAYLAADLQEKDGELVILLVRKNLQIFFEKQPVSSGFLSNHNHRDCVTEVISLFSILVKFSRSSACSMT
jgi:hypothetical protein